MPQTLSATLDLLERLVSFNTETQNSNLALIDDVAAYLARHNIPFTRFPNAAGDKAAILATIGPMVDGGIVLSGHTDVVPVAGQEWSSDPYRLRREADKVFGRGTCDMKAFGAVALTLAPELMRLPLKAPIHILLSYDEETTCLGVMDAIAAMGARLPRPRAVLVGEPTQMQVADAHKGCRRFLTRVAGFEVHSSNPQLGVNAILIAAKLIVELERLHDEMRQRGDHTGRFTPPHTTIHTGVISGGSAINIVPRDARFEWEFRAIPGLDYEEIPSRLAAFGEQLLAPARSIFPGAAVITEETVNLPGLAPDAGSVAESLALLLVDSNRTITVPYGSEAGRFQSAGIPTVLCGPGNIAQAHQPDEWIAISEIESCIRFVRRLGERLAA
jgi:acetylornithine deacetylase